MLSKKALFILSCFLIIHSTTRPGRVKSYVAEVKLLFENCSEITQKRFLSCHLPMLLRVQEAKEKCDKKCGSWSNPLRYKSCIKKEFFRSSDRYRSWQNPPEMEFFTQLASWFGVNNNYLEGEEKEQALRELKEYLLQKTQDLHVYNIETIKQLYPEPATHPAEQQS